MILTGKNEEFNNIIVPLWYTESNSYILWHKKMDQRILIFFNFSIISREKNKYLRKNEENSHNIRMKEL